MLALNRFLFSSAAGLLLAGVIAAVPKINAEEWYVPSSHPNEIRKGRECMVVADRRIFAVMAFINAAGFDDEAKGKTMHPVRVKVRESVTANLQSHSNKLAVWKENYARLKCSNADYIEYAMLLSADHPFKKVGPDSLYYNQEVLRKLGGVADQVNDFWTAARLDEVWNAVKPDYLAEIQKYDITKMSEDLDFVWQYVRMPRREARIMVSVPNLLDRYYSADSMGCGKYFVSVEGPGSHDYRLNVHEYLHEIVNPAVARWREEYSQRLQPYFDRWMKHPAHRGYETVQMYVQECLVKALEARISVKLRPELRNRKNAQVAQDVKNGYELTGVLHESLADSETDQKAFDDFVKVLFERLPQ
jgi:hypothetical protein